MGAVVPLPALPYLKSRSKEEMVGLLEGGGCACTGCLPAQGFCRCGLERPHRLLLVPSAGMVP